MKADSILQTIGKTPHVRINRLFGDRAEVAQHGVERVELEEVAVPADRRAGAGVADPAPVVLPLARPVGEGVAVGAEGELAHRGGDVVEHPVDVGPLGRLRVGGVGSSPISA